MLVEAKNLNRSEAIRDIGKNAEQNLSLNSSLSLFTFPMLWMEVVSPSQKKGNNFYRRFSCVMPKIVKHA